jgi:radical SAM protein with 4Fe4S-binding SPASM domain
MLVNKYIEEKNIKAFILGKLPKCYMEQRANKHYNKAFEKKLHSLAEHSLPDTIQIETINRCNGTCSFCPVNKYVDTRKMKKMELTLYKKILQDLANLEYKGRIALYSNNEPLLDDRILEFAKMTKEILPECYLYIYTNGTLMTRELCMELVKYMDSIIIDNYNDDLELNENIKEIYDMCQNVPELDNKIEIHLRKVNEVLYTRGGQSPNNSKKKERNYPCMLPFSQMVIRPDGGVSLCCSDALGKMTLGNANEQTIEEIWNSSKYSEIRNKIVTDIRSIELCKYCDAKHYE